MAAVSAADAPLSDTQPITLLLNHILPVHPLANPAPCSNNRAGHHWVHCLGLSPDGRLALSGEKGSGQLLLWDTATAEVMARWQAHEGQVENAAFSPGGNYALTGGEDGVARLWDVRTRKLRKRFGVKNPLGVLAVAFAPKGPLILTAGERGTASLWDVKTGVMTTLLRGGEGDLNAAGFSADGEMAYAGCCGAVANDVMGAWQWDVATGKLGPCVRGPSRAAMRVSCAALSPDGRWFLCAGRVTRIVERTQDLGEKLLRAYSPLINLVTPTTVKITEYHIEAWSMARATMVHDYQGHEGEIRSLAVSSNGALALSGAEDSTVRSWGLPG